MNDISVNVLQTGKISVSSESPDTILTTASNGSTIEVFVSNDAVVPTIVNQVISTTVTNGAVVNVTIPTQEITVEISSGDVLPDAPSDNHTYARRNKTWIVIGDSGGLPDAPIDGEIYGRKDGEWSAIGFIITNIDGGDSESSP